MRLIVFLTATLLLAAPHIASANGEQRLNPAEARMLASTALLRGDLALAARVSDALIEGDSEDVEALLIRAAVALESGRYDLSQQAAKQAWTATDKPAVRHHAALLSGQALEQTGRYFQSQFWLRRALQAAPDDAADAEARRAYRAVQRSNPWRVELGFGIAPSSNINNGTAAETVRLFGLDFQVSRTAQALSGLEIFTRAQFSRRLFFGKQHRTEFVFSSQFQRYWLSRESRRNAPDLDAKQLSYEDLSIGLSHQHLLNENVKIDGVVGLTRSRRAGTTYSDQLEFGSKFTFPLKRGTALVAVAELTQEWLNTSDREDTVSGISGVLGLRQVLSKHVVWGNVEVKRVQSDRDSLSYRLNTVTLGLALRESVFGAQLAGSIDIGRRRYSSPWRSGAERNDDVSSAKMSAVFTELEQYGFSPRLDLFAQRRSSSIDFYDQNALGMRLGIQSTF